MDVAQLLNSLHQGDPRGIGRAISHVEDQGGHSEAILDGLDRQRIEEALVIGITGPPGAGKSTLTGSLIRELRTRAIRVGIIAIDPSSPISGGAILGDRIRMMDHALDRDVVIRSMATRGRLGGLCASAGSVVRIMAASGCRVVLLETVGVGQSEMDIVRLADLTVMVLAPGFGDDIQAMKAGILEVADLMVINKADKPGAEKLAMDLGSWFSVGRSSSAGVMKTIAREHVGVPELLERLFDLEQEHRSRGVFEQKRKKAFELETIDWALEMVRHRLEGTIDTTIRHSQDPRIAAAVIVGSLFSEE